LYFCKIYFKLFETITNLTDGGNEIESVKFSDEVKLKMSQQRKGKKLKPMSEETKQKISISKLGKNTGEKHYLFGKHLKDETKQKIKISRGSKYSGEFSGMYNRHHTKETKLKQSLVKQGLYDGINNPNYGRKHLESEKIVDTWKITFNNNISIIFDNMTKYCRENNYNVSCMKDVMNNKCKTHKNVIKVEKLTNNVKNKKEL
jgi:hypothetical protein